MNNKNVKYILIAVVVIIWGSIGYKIINGLASTQPFIPPVTNSITLKDTLIATDTFTLLADYPDPFLWQQNDTVQNNAPIIASKENSEAYNTQVSEPVLHNPPAVKYLGFIKNGKNKMAIILINEQEMTVKEKEKIDDIMILKIDYMLLSIKSHGNEYTIRLER